MYSAILASAMLGMASVASVAVVPHQQQAPAGGRNRLPTLLVPVSQSSPNATLGADANLKTVTVKWGQPVEVGFEVPFGPGYGTLCDLYFALPSKTAHTAVSGAAQSAYGITGSARFSARVLGGGITKATTFSNRPAPFGYTWTTHLADGGDYLFATVACPPNGQQLAFEVTAATEDASVTFPVPGGGGATAGPPVGLVLYQHH